jgi:sugar O-acyltransferase (sialic acid O-acetyltransferase NeuD family)
VSEAKSFYLFGYSGHAFVVIETILALGHSIKGYFDFKESENNPYGLTYLGFEGDTDIQQIIGEDYVFPSIGDNLIRYKLLQLFREKSLKQYTIIDPSALISHTAKIGSSTYVGKGCLLNAQVQVGDAVIINTGAIVEHESIVSDGCHIAPGAVICGNVQVGESTIIGASSVIRQNILVSRDVMLGAGSVLVKSIEHSGMWMGNPAKKIK